MSDRGFGAAGLTVLEKATIRLGPVVGWYPYDTKFEPIISAHRKGITIRAVVDDDLQDQALACHEEIASWWASGAPRAADRPWSHRLTHHQTWRGVVPLPGREDHYVFPPERRRLRRGDHSYTIPLSKRRKVR